jgi:hypothetical protein
MISPILPETHKHIVVNVPDQRREQWVVGVAAPPIASLRTSEALQTIKEAESLAATSGEHWGDAELHRLCPVWYILRMTSRIKHGERGRVIKEIEKIVTMAVEMASM